ncbi:hypothetical protein I4U23_007153 [Adineta vaga]|nr:hypothetical protein I4U23_007153 [Adineta vaga]
MADVAQDTSFGFVLPNTPTSQATCNICKRLLYPFEEVLRCRSCRGSNHWRCIEPKTISQYGDNEDFICAKCNDDTTNTSSKQTTNNGSFRLKSTDSTNRNYRSTETSVGNTIRYFEEKQQQQRSQTPKMTKVSELDRYLPSPYNYTEYRHNGQDQDDRRTPQRIQQQQHQNGIESDDEHDSSAMFQANYQYTSLKDYAAMKTVRARSENNINEYPSPSSNQQTTSRYGGGLQYTNHGYDPTVSRLVEPPASISTDMISPLLNTRPNHFISTTNLTINERPSDFSQQQLTTPIRSTTHSSQARDNDVSIMTSSSKLQEHQSTHDIDSDITMTKFPNDQTKGTPVVEKKVTALVQQLGKQLETDAQKINEKLEVKIKNLENMIHQQTLIIQRQDEVIERLKSRIAKFETNYDQTPEQNETSSFTPNENNRVNRKLSSSSTTITQSSIGSTKKISAPRLNQQWSTTSDEKKLAPKKLVNNTPINRNRKSSDSSSMPSMDGILPSSVPATNEPKAASSRLDHIIHQTDSTVTNKHTSDYNLAPIRHQDRSQISEPISMVQEQFVTTVHHDDNAPKNSQNMSKSIIKPKRSSSLSSNSSGEPTRKPIITAKSSASRYPDVHRSFDAIPNSQPIKQTVENI